MSKPLTQDSRQPKTTTFDFDSEVCLLATSQIRSYVALIVRDFVAFKHLGTKPGFMTLPDFACQAQKRQNLGVALDRVYLFSSRPFLTFQRHSI
jgi:hypothetical protein